MVRSKRWGVIGLLMAATLILASCSLLDSDDPNPQAPTATEQATTTTPDPSPSISATLSATVTPSPTVTPEPTATSTATPTPTVSPTPTPDPITRQPFAEVVAPYTVLTNYTLHYASTTTNTADDSKLNALLELQQHAADQFHLLSAGTNPHVQPLELWLIGDQAFTTMPNGAIEPIGGAIDPNLFSIKSYFAPIPDLTGVAVARKAGVEEVDGRLAMHFEVEAEQLMGADLKLPADVASIEGNLDVWIDQELGFLSRIEGNIEWQAADGSQFRTELEMKISGVNATPEIQVPS